MPILGHKIPMNTSPAPSRWSSAWATFAAAVAGLGLVGWWSPGRRLFAIFPDAYPMAPNTSIAFLLLAVAVLLHARRPWRARTITLSGVVLGLCALQIHAFLEHGTSAVEDLLAPEAGKVGDVALGRMSPLTTLGLLLASLHLLFVALAPRRPAVAAGGGIAACVVLLVGAIVVLGYLFGAPLLYGGTIVPMAFGTGLAFLGLGLALLGLVPRDLWPRRPFVGNSARATMLRAFLPVPPVTIAVAMLFGQVEGINPALHAALATLLSGLVVAFGVAVAARSVGRQLDRATAERDRSQRQAERLAAIVQSSDDAIYTRNPEGTITWWNPGAERLLGYTAEEMLGRPVHLLEAASPQPRTDLGGGARRDDVRLRRKDGTLVAVSYAESVLRDGDDQVEGIAAIARDISAQKRAEAEVRENARALRVYFESNVVGILFGDRTVGLEANEEFLRIVGYSREDLAAGRIRWSDLTPPEFTEIDAAASVEARVRGACTPYEKQYFRKDGTRVWVLVSFVMLDVERERHVGFAVHIDARKRAEDDLRQAEERFAKVFHSQLMAIGIAEVASGRLIDVNARCADFFGYDRAEMVGRTVEELGLWEDTADRARMIASLESGLRPVGVHASFRRKSGETRRALVTMEKVTLSGHSESLNMVGFLDVTERERLEQQLLQAQKLEAVGRLAGGIAHDFNNLLSVILGYTELVLLRASGPDRAKLEQVTAAAKRAAELTAQLLAFSRKQVVEPRVLDLNAVVADLEKMLRRLIGEDIDLGIVREADLGKVKADPGQIAQVLMNLSVNARDAMPHGGRLHIEAANVDVDSAAAGQHAQMTPGRYVRIAVSDTGCGIPKEHLPMIFEPFFTTKEPGKGTGLGLSTVYGIVRQAGGFVGVYSEVGQGTTFKVYLPRVDEPVTPDPQPRMSGERTGSETILLVEDEPSLRALAREVLGQNGYEVIEASEGEAALDASRSRTGPLHLLLTDVVMPGLNGRQLAETLTRERPTLRVLYMSGYTDDIIAHRGVLESDAMLLVKPFSSDALLRAVRRAIDAPRSPPRPEGGFAPEAVISPGRREAPGDPGPPPAHARA